MQIRTYNTSKPVKMCKKNFNRWYFFQKIKERVNVCTRVSENAVEGSGVATFLTPGGKTPPTTPYSLKRTRLILSTSRPSFKVLHTEKLIIVCFY